MTNAHGTPATPHRRAKTILRTSAVTDMGTAHTAWKRRTPAPLRKTATAAPSPLMSAQTARPARSQYEGSTVRPTHKEMSGRPNTTRTTASPAVSTNVSTSVRTRVRLTQWMSPRVMASP